MDQKNIDAFRSSYLKSWRAAKIQLVVAVIFAVVAGFLFAGGHTFAGVCVSIGAVGTLFAAVVARSAAQHIEPFIGSAPKG